MPVIRLSRYATLAALAIAAPASLAQDCDDNGVPDANEVGLVLLDEDFESGLPAGWTADGLWSVTGECRADCGGCGDGAQWASFSVAPACSFNTGQAEAGTLGSPSFMIPANAASIRVTFCSRYEGESGQYPAGFDAAALIAEVDGGVAFDLLDDVAFTTPIVDEGRWLTRTADLSAYAGTSVRLLFEFDSIDEINNNGLGWQVDNVRVTYSLVPDCDGNLIPDACELTQVIYSEDFEGGEQPFPFVLTGIWGVTDLCGLMDGNCDNGSSWAYFGQPGPGGPPDCTFDTGSAESGQIVVSPQTLPDTEVITLRYCSRYEGEADAWPPDPANNFDTAAVFVVTDLDSPPGTSILVDNVSETALPITDTGWEVRQVDLSAFAGQEIGLVFAFDSADASGNDYLGWQVDNIEITTNGAADCDGDGVLDICEIEADPNLDCDRNSLLDACEVSDNPLADRNTDGIIDDCTLLVTNETDGTLFTALDLATSDPGFDSNDVLRLSLATRGRLVDFPADTTISDLRNWLTNELIAPHSAEWRLADGLSIGNNFFGFLAAIGGQIILPFGADAALTSQLELLDGGSLRIEPVAVLNMPIFGIFVDCGTIELLGGAIQAATIQIGFSTEFSPEPFPDSRLRGFGIVEAPVFVSAAGELVVQADTQLLQELDVVGRVIVQSGTLTVLGDLLVNGGEIIGDVSTPAIPLAAERYAERAQGDGLFVAGELATLPTGGLRMPSPDQVLRVGGDFDVELTDNTRFEMSVAELRAVGIDGAQSFETMSTDRGPADLASYDRDQPGSFPIGTLRIGPTSTTVNLVDQHDNDQLGQETCEAIYVETLIIEPGAALNTNSCKVYYRQLVNNGSVDDPANLVPAIVCGGDVDGDNDTDVFDFGELALAFGTSPGQTNWNPAADLDPNGTIDVFDFAVLAEDFGCGP